MSQKGRAARGRSTVSAHPIESHRRWASTVWRVGAASCLTGLATLTAGLVVAGPAGATVGTASSAVTSAVYDAGTAGAWTGKGGGTGSGQSDCTLGNCCGPARSAALRSTGTAGNPFSGNGVGQSYWLNG